MGPLAFIHAQGFIGEVALLMSLPVFADVATFNGTGPDPLWRVPPSNGTCDDAGACVDEASGQRWYGMVS